MNILNISIELLYFMLTLICYGNTANSNHDELLLLLLHYVYSQNFICIKKHAYHVLKFTFTTLPRCLHVIIDRGNMAANFAYIG